MASRPKNVKVIHFGLSPAHHFMWRAVCTELSLYTLHPRFICNGLAYWDGNSEVFGWSRSVSLLDRKPPLSTLYMFIYTYQHIHTFTLHRPQTYHSIDLHTLISHVCMYGDAACYAIWNYYLLRLTVRGSAISAQVGSLDQRSGKRHEIQNDFCKGFELCYCITIGTIGRVRYPLHHSACQTNYRLKLIN